MMKTKILLLSLLALNSTWASLSHVSEDELVAATLILEAGGERHPYSMVAVYEVIRNRAERRNQSMRHVILARLQFSCWNDIENRDRLFQIARSHPRYETALRIVREKTNTNITRGATHYHATRVSPYWKTSYTETITIQNHIFYR